MSNTRQVSINKDTDNYFNDSNSDITISSTQPSKYVTAWIEEDRNTLLNIIHKHNEKHDKNKHFLDNKKLMDKLSKTLERSEGGIKSEIKKIIFNKYLDGITFEEISKLFNTNPSIITSLYNQYLDKNSDKKIELLEKENKILKLRSENKKLLDELRDNNKS